MLLQYVEQFLQGFSGFFYTPSKVAEGDSDTVLGPAIPSSLHLPYTRDHHTLPHLTRVPPARFEVHFVKLCFISSCYRGFCWAVNVQSHWKQHPEAAGGSTLEKGILGVMAEGKFTNKQQDS